MGPKPLFRTAPWRSLAVFLAGTVGSIFVPMLIASEILNRLPQEMQTVDIGFAFGILGAWVGFVVWWEVWKRTDIGDHFMKWDNWSETVNYPQRGTDE